MKLYLGNKMTGVPYFNAPWFDKNAAALLALPGVDEVFNPAERDRAAGFEPMDCPNGTSEEAKAAGFVARSALGEDWAWIASNSNGLIVGSQWHDSPGTISEIACHQALRLPVWDIYVFLSMYAHPYLHQLVLQPIMELGGECSCDRIDWGA